MDRTWLALSLAPTLLTFTLTACPGSDPPSNDDGGRLCATSGDCDDGIFCNGPERCAPDDPAADDRGCVPGGEPCAAGTCNEEARDCTSGCVDADGDGFESVDCGGTDCDDGNPDVFPGATERCDADGVDEDCDPTTFGDRDLDSDGYVDPRCCNGDSCGTDCDETRAGTHPAVPEVCDGRDNDCDGSVDEELLEERYADRDRDLQGDPDAPILACPGRAGTSASVLDCDDTDPKTNASASEIDDDADNDCDELIDEGVSAVAWYVDADGDGFGDPDSAAVSSSVPIDGRSVSNADCDDSRAAVNPLATEICNGLDDDCNGDADFVIGINDWEDDDGDGAPDSNCGGSDCDDIDPAIRPGAPERCNGLDDDCDGSVDERCDEPPDIDAGVPETDAGLTEMDAGTPGTDAGPSDAPYYTDLASARSDGVVMYLPFSEGSGGSTTDQGSAHPGAAVTFPGDWMSTAADTRHGSVAHVPGSDSFTPMLGVPAATSFTILAVIPGPDLIPTIAQTPAEPLRTPNTTRFSATTRNGTRFATTVAHDAGGWADCADADEWCSLQWTDPSSYARSMTRPRSTVENASGVVYAFFVYTPTEQRWRLGMESGSGVVSTLPSLGADELLWIGRDFGGNAFNSYLLSLAIWSRALSDTEMENIIATDRELVDGY